MEKLFEVLAALHFWLDSWRGIGAVGGMGVLRTSPDDPTLRPGPGGMRSDLVRNPKALSPARKARNNTNRMLISAVFIGTPVSIGLRSGERMASSRFVTI
jgi:hypothetical protein